MPIKTIEKIKEIRTKILSDFSNTMYSRISGDTYFERISESLYKLWYSDGNHAFAACNMDQYINKCIGGKMEEHELYSMMQDLLEKFKREFELLNQ